MKSKQQRNSPRLKYQLLLSAGWGVLLFYEGLISPLPDELMLGFIVYLGTGLPTVLFYVWEASNGYIEFTMSEFLKNLIVYGPFLTIFSALVAGYVILVIYRLITSGEFQLIPHVEGIIFQLPLIQLLVS